MTEALKSAASYSPPSIDLRSRLDEPLAHVETSALDRAETLVEALRALTDEQGDFVSLRIIGRDSRETRITPKELWSRARQLHAHFVRVGLEPGGFGILSLPAGLELLAAYFAVVMAGATPGLVASPSNRFADRARYAARIAGILQNARGRVLYCEDQCLELFAQTGGLDRKAVLSPADTAEAFEAVPLVDVTPDTIATIQYSSGATGAPKGVLITHGAVLENLRALRDGFRMVPTDVFVNWLPLYHDMGLMGTFLLPLFMGSPIVLIPTLEFMREPKLWLWAHHHYRGTFSFAPNFALAYCAKRIPSEELEGLDLSSWRVLCNGSEPILGSTMEEFVKRYRRYGFPPLAMQTGWGMAENVLAATTSDPRRPLLAETIDRVKLAHDGEATPTAAKDGLTLYSVGRALRGVELEVRDDARGVLPDRKLGQIWLRSPSLFVGYHGQPEASAKVLRDGWFDTGDRGYLADGELFFVSREKDLVVIGGEKYAPHDIEAAISEVPGVRTGCVAAFGWLSEKLGTEAIVAVVETHETEKPALKMLRDAIVDQVKRALGLSIHHLFLVPPGGVEKTTSGKIARGATRERYAGEITS